ncbi:MAG: GntR family transcriptional regulator [Eubacteriales bacterium]
MARTRSNASELALKKILKKINSYDLSSGDVVSDLELSREFTMSRTPIREAISRLIDAGVLERTSTKVVVKTITLDDINEILVVKEAIELMSVRLIIEEGGLSKSEEKSLLDLHETLKDDVSQGKFEDNFNTDAAFHSLIVSYSKNSRLLTINKQIDIQVQRLRWITILTPSQFSITLDEHAAIIDAIRSKDLPMAETAISKHSNSAKKNYANIISNSHWSKLMKELSTMQSIDE